MEIKCLIENTTISETYMPEHGLSLWIKTPKHQILFDFGASDQFIHNAQSMGVDLTLVDFGILSHGHSDHGGGLKPFFEVNTQGVVYVNQHAFEAHYSEREGGQRVNIGLDPSLAENHRIIPVGKSIRMDEGLFIFSDVEGKFYLPAGNQTLLEQSEGGFLKPDGFSHEQNLIVEWDGKALRVVHIGGL